MALPNSGPLSLNQIHVEAGGSSGSTASINDADIRGLIGKSSEATMSFNEWYGASSAVTISQTISSSTNNYNMASSRGPTYSPGITNYTLTVNPGVIVGSNSTTGDSLATGTSWTSGDTITVNNYGTISGRGGDGGLGSFTPFTDQPPGTFNAPGWSDGAAGGTVNGAAIKLNYPTTIKNFGSVYGAGGGGGGAGGGAFSNAPFGKTSGFTKGFWGGSGGGGAGTVAGGAVPAKTYPPNTPQSIPSANVDASSAGSANAGGSGSATFVVDILSFSPAPGNQNYGGGAGGGLGSAGSDGAPRGGTPGGGSIDFSKPVGAGGNTGYYINGNPFASWSPTGTRGGRSV